MRPVPRVVSFVIATILAIACLLHDPCRVAVVYILRAPFAAVRALTGWLLVLPGAGGILRENRELRRELARQQLELAELREQRRQEQQERALLAAGPSLGGVVAAVLGRSPWPIPQTLWLDRGRRDGVSVESLVLDGVGVVGRVSDVQPSSCLVTLLSDPESRLGALLERSRETGLLVGRGHGRCELLYLDADADVQTQDRVLSAGLSDGVPKGLLLGTVVRVVKHEEAGHTSAWVAPAARLGRVEEVLCLLQGGSSARQP